MYCSDPTDLNDPSECLQALISTDETNEYIKHPEIELSSGELISPSSREERTHTLTLKVDFNKPYLGLLLPMTLSGCSNYYSSKG